MVCKQIGKKFLDTGILLLSPPKNTFMLLICQILNKYNYKVLLEHYYLIIDQKLMVCNDKFQYGNLQSENFQLV